MAGIDAVGHDRLRRLRCEPNWPSDLVFNGGRYELVPRKALAHAAILCCTGGVRLLAGYACAGQCSCRSMTPPHQAPGPSSRPCNVALVRDGWDIIMHGYFWPSHDRRSIPGVTLGADDGMGESGVRAQWNRGIRDELMLPLLPAALEHAVRKVSQDSAWDLLHAVARTETVQTNISSVTKKHLLLPVVTQSGVRWKAAGAGGARVLDIPLWKGAPSSVRKAFVTRTEGAHGVIFIDADAPRIGGTPDTWPACWIEVLLSCVSIDLLRDSQVLLWVVQCVRHVLGPQQNGEDDARSTVVADWLAKRVGEGALTAGGPETRQEMRTSWRRVYEALPQKWLVYAPIESGPAVAKLAAAGVVGAGLLPIPFGSHRKWSLPRILTRTDWTVRCGNLGRSLRTEEGTSQKARLVLAETLLSVRGDRPLDAGMTRLRLLRLSSFPKAETTLGPSANCANGPHNTVCSPGATRRRRRTQDRP